MQRFISSFVIALLVLESGCGAIQLAWYTPDNEKHNRVENEMDNWSKWDECFGGPLSVSNVSHSVFCLPGKPSKPPVLLLHEMNGLTADTFRYATELSKDFTVYLPMLFGSKGEESVYSGMKAYWFQGFWKFFPEGEWGNPEEGRPPIVKWLREVVLKIQDKHKSSPIRIIGNCMTGALPLALLNIAGTNVDAVVVAQPALPMRLLWWYTDKDKGSLNLSEEDWKVARQSNAKVLALRFETDWISHPNKFETLRGEEALKARLIEDEICARDYQPKGTTVRAHSTLIGETDTVGRVGELSKQKRERVRRFLLNPGSIAKENGRCSSERRDNAS